MWLLLPLSIDQLLSHIRVALVDTISSLHYSPGRVISVSEVHKLLTKIHHVLVNAVSKNVGNTACILAPFLNSTSRQHHEVWALQFPFLHRLKDTVPPSETCLYGYINWSLAQAQQQSSRACLNIFFLWEMAKPGQRLGSISMGKTYLHQSLMVPLWQRSLTWESNTEAHQGSRKSSGGGVSANCRKKAS